MRITVTTAPKGLNMTAMFGFSRKTARPESGLRLVGEVAGTEFAAIHSTTRNGAANPVARRIARPVQPAVNSDRKAPNEREHD